MGVIITNGHNRISYAVVRGLSQAGIEVAVGDTLPFSMVALSRHVHRRFVYPSPATDPDGFVAALAEQVRITGHEVIMPIYDEIFAVAGHRDALARYAHVASPSYEQIEMVHDKMRMQELARSLNIATPRTILPASTTDVQTAATRWRRPLVLKPSNRWGSWGVTYVPHEADLAAVYQKTCRRLHVSQLLIQEFVTGQEYGVAMLYDHGRLITRFSHRLLVSFGAAGGTATVRESVHMPQMEAALKKLLDHLQWHGVCQADFILEQDTGQWLLLDINPRFWGSLFCAIAAGVNFPLLLYRLACGQHVDPILNYPSGVKTRWFWGDLLGLFTRLRHSPNRLATLRQFGRLRQSGLAYDDWCRDDPLPFFISPFIPLADSLWAQISSRVGLRSGKRVF